MKTRIIEMEGEKWAVEVHDDISIHGFKIEKKLYSEKSPFQDVEVFKTKGLGKALFNDGITMISERDEFVYHEMIAHLPLFTHPHPEKVLIIGGGDGGTAREVLKHESVKKCVMVEIDSLVLEACKKHIPQTSSELENPRLDLKVADGVDFIKETKEVFDLVIIDSSDPIGPSAPLFNLDFYEGVRKKLKPKGIVVSQCESPFYEMKAQKSLLSILNKCFNISQIYNYSNLTYPGGLWSFSFASQELDPLKDFLDEKVKKSKIEFNYYNEKIHRASFCLPQFMKKELKDYLK